MSCLIYRRNVPSKISNSRSFFRKHFYQQTLDNTFAGNNLFRIYSVAIYLRFNGIYAPFLTARNKLQHVITEIRFPWKIDTFEPVFPGKIDVDFYFSEEQAWATLDCDWPKGDVVKRCRSVLESLSWLGTLEWAQKWRPLFHNCFVFFRTALRSLLIKELFGLYFRTRKIYLIRFIKVIHKASLITASKKYGQ